MADNERSRNIKAGVFVLVAIALAVGITIALAGGGRLFQATNRYVVRFSLEEGASGLTEGSPVNVGGRAVGRVESVDLAFGEHGRRPVGVNVLIEIDSRIPLHTDAQAFLEKPLLGSGAAINFPDLGGGPEAKPLQPGAMVQGGWAPAELLRSAGYGPEQTQQLRRILERFDTMARRAERTLQDLQQRIVPDLVDASDDLRTVAGDVRERSGPWMDRADRFTSDLVSISDQAGRSIDEARAFIGSLNEIVEENRASFGRTVSRLDSASGEAETLMRRLNDQSVELLEAMLKDGRAAADEARQTVNRLNTLLDEQAPSMRKAVANLRLASDQLRLTMGEVRRAPWRLLYRPKTRELEYELLYDAARTYASAVSDLRSATESLEAAASTRSADPEQAASVRERIEQIDDAFEKYRRTERAFLELLAEEAPE